jgi:O-antigen ligase
MRSWTLDSSEPNLLPALFLAAFAAAIILTSDSLGSIRLVLVGVVLVPVGVYFLSRNAAAALAALIASSAMPRYFATLGATKVRPEHVAVGMVLVAAVFLYRRDREWPKWIFADVLLLAYVALNLFSSTFRSVDPTQTLKWSVQQVLVIAAYFLIRFLAANEERFRSAVKIMLLVGAIEGIYAALSFYSNLWFGTDFGLDPYQYEYGEIPAVYGTQFEANLLGSYCAACLVLMVVMYFRKPARRYLWGIGATYMGLLVSFSRAALFSAAVALLGLTVYTIVGRATTRTTLLRLSAVFVIVTVLVGAAVLPSYVQRFSTIEVSDPAADANTRVRLLTLGVAVQHILENPILGSGTSSFQLMFDNKEIGFFEEEGSGWISNTEIRVLHDTGAVGLVVFAWFVLALMVRGIRDARRSRSPELSGLLLSSVVYFIAFQATEGTLLAFSWVHLGLIATAVALFGKAGAETKPPQAVAVGNV